jgi:hypothetical protein
MRRTISLFCAAALAATGLSAVASPASAALNPWTYAAYSGATQINALGTTIQSGLTAQSSLTGSEVPNSAQTQVASVHVGTLANVGVITSGQEATATLGGTKITSTVEIAGLDLLNGAIKADAIESSSTASASLLGLSGDTATKFVHLTIGGHLIPIDVGKNTRITIPGVADVVLNETKVDIGPGTVRTYGAALHVTLLKANSGAPAGAEIWVNPTLAMLMPTPDSDAAPVFGSAYSTYVAAAVGNNVKVLSQPTGVVSVPIGGTNGVKYTASLASVKLQNVLTVGALQNSVTASTVPGFADVATESEIAKVNLLNGLITADAIDVNAHVRNSAADNVSETRMNLVHLVIAGKPYPVNVAPNTEINIAGIARIFINQRVVTPNAAAIIGLRVVLSTAKYGLPIGADIQVAVASARIGG